jgi:hypothetical protein
MVNITVAMIVAATVSNAWMNVQTAIANDHHRLFMTMGVMKIETNVMQMPVKKNPNMRLLAILINFRILVISAGKAIVAPERSSLSRISTGLNQ